MKTTLGHAHASRTAGWTLIELLIGVTILTIVAGTVGMVVSSGQGAYSQDFVNSQVDAVGRRTIDFIAGELIDADRSSIVLLPGGPVGATSVEYQRGQGWGGALVTTPTRSLRLELMPGELDDGIDNNGNGLIDECRVVFTPDVDGAPGVSVTRANWVRGLLEGELPNGVDDNGNGVADEGGLFLTFDPDTGMFTAQLTLERITSEGRLVTRTVRTSVRVRNERSN
jgi:hypothetical protein